MEVNSLHSSKLKWTIAYEQTASKANVQPACCLYFLRKAHYSLFNVNSTKWKLTAYHVLNKHKVTKTLNNFPWCKDTKVLAGESLCLQFSGVALRAFVSLCLIVLWFFIAPPAPEACRRTHVNIIETTTCTNWLRLQLAK